MTDTSATRTSDWALNEARAALGPDATPETIALAALVLRILPARLGTLSEEVSRARAFIQKP
jgi:hypothetical protein